MPDAMRYTRWEDISPHLQTRTQLARQGLRPARGQEPAATMRNTLHPAQPYALYDVGQAIPKRPATPAQRAALAAARHRAYALRHYGTCPMCCATEVPREDLERFGQCDPCAEAEEAAQRAEDWAEAVAWARTVLADPRAVVLDTETTDLDGEVIEIAVLTMAGEVLLDTLVCPAGVLGPISPAATEVHGLTMADVAEAPRFAQLSAQVAALLQSASRIVAWNSAFDYFTLQRTCALAQVADLAQPTSERWACAMEMYAQWWGDYSDYHGDYRWQPLGGGHRAREDCLAVLERLRTMEGSTAVRDLSTTPVLPC